MKVVVLTFLFNDWASAALVLDQLDNELFKSGMTADALVIDDASSEARPADFGQKAYQAIKSVKVVRLCKNLGHQRAIAVGLCYAHEHRDFDVIVVMDADGEDLPSDVVRLIARAGETACAAVVFAERSRRSEGAIFRIFYQLYRVTHLILTGKGIRFGNFSVIPRAYVSGLVVEPNLWNHYAAAVVNSRVPNSTIPATRGRRLHGTSKLNFTALVLHGLSAIACYSEVIGVRVLLASLVLACAALLAIVTIIFVTVTTDFALAGWAMMTIGLLALGLLQILSMASLFTFSVLNNRKEQSTIPLRDYKYYVRSNS